MLIILIYKRKTIVNILLCYGTALGRKINQFVYNSFSFVGTLFITDYLNFVTSFDHGNSEIFLYDLNIIIKCPEYLLKVFRGYIDHLFNYRHLILTEHLVFP